MLASGAIERPLVFPGNDRPGIMLASAVETYLNRYAVAPGRRPQLALPLFGDSAYPPPVLDHEKAARDFLARYADFVRDSA